MQILLVTISTRTIRINEAWQDLVNKSLYKAFSDGWKKVKNAYLDHSVDSMADSIGGNEVSINNLGVVSLAINGGADFDGTGMVLSDSELITAHSGDMVVVDAIGKDGLGDDVSEEDLRKGRLVFQEPFNGTSGKLIESIVGGAENSEGSLSGEGVGQIGGLNSGQKSAESLITGQDLGQVLVSEGGQNVVDDVDDTVVGGNVGLGDASSVHSEEGVSGSSLVVVESQLGSLNGVGDQLVGEIGRSHGSRDQVILQHTSQKLGVSAQSIQSLGTKLGKGFVGWGKDCERTPIGQGISQTGGCYQFNQLGEPGFSGDLSEVG